MVTPGHDPALAPRHRPPPLAARPVHARPAGRRPSRPAPASTPPGDGPGRPGHNSCAPRPMRSCIRLLHGGPTRQHPGLRPGRDRTRDLAHPRGHPASYREWTAQQACYLLMDLNDQAHRVKFVIRDRGSNFTAAFTRSSPTSGSGPALQRPGTPHERDHRTLDGRMQPRVPGPRLYILAAYVAGLPGKGPASHDRCAWPDRPGRSQAEAPEHNASPCEGKPRHASGRSVRLPYLAAGGQGSA